jgi:hypothetical protein
MSILHSASLVSVLFHANTYLLFFSLYSILCSTLILRLTCITIASQVHYNCEAAHYHLSKQLQENEHKEEPIVAHDAASKTREARLLEAEQSFANAKKSYEKAIRIFAHGCNSIG